VIFLVLFPSGAGWLFIYRALLLLVTAGTVIVLILLGIARTIQCDYIRRRFFKGCWIVAFFPIIFFWVMGLWFGSYAILMSIFITTIWLPVSISVTFAHWLYNHINKVSDKTIVRKPWSFRNYMVVFGTAIIGLPTIVFVPMLTNPLRRPPEMVANYFLGITPIGTSMEDVIAIVEDQFAPFRHSPRILEREVISIVGGYIAPWYRLLLPIFETNVHVFWRFDEAGYLTEVNVWKDTFI